MLKDATPFIISAILFAAVTILAANYYSTYFYILTALFVLLAVFVAYFFRNPDRNSPTDPNLVLSPADGHVSFIKPGSDSTVVSVFLSVFDVHVNRTPIAGTITKVEYKEGQFLNALNHRSSSDNEQNVITVRNDQMEVTFSQIAGVIARRIVFWPKVGDALQAGERIGLIKFGSRTDIVLPLNVKIEVVKGQKVVGGLTVIGRLTNE